MPGIFISYRREGSAGYAGRLHEKLEARFGRGRVFRDVDTLEPGQDFVQAIEGRLEECRAFLALIGLEWLQAKDHAGRRRLDQPDDYLRHEIAAALSRPGLLVIPVLTEGVTMPAAEDLPENLRSLTQRQAISLRDETWDYDVERLGTTIAKTLGAAEPPAREQRVPARPARPTPSRDEPSRSVASIPRRKLLLSGVVVAMVLAIVLILPRVLPTGEGGADARSESIGPPQSGEDGKDSGPRTTPSALPLREEKEPNDQSTEANVIEVGMRLRGYLATDTDKDFLRLRTSDRALSNIRVILRDLSSSLRIAYVTVYDEVKRVVAEGSAPWEEPVSLAFESAPNSLYYIRISTEYGMGRGPYELELRYEASERTIVEEKPTDQPSALPLREEKEPNDQSTEANVIEVGMRLRGYLATDTDKDFLRLRTSDRALANIRVILRDLSSSLRIVYVTVYDEVKRVVAEGSAPWEEPVSLAFESAPNSLYYIRISTEYGMGRGPYELELRYEASER